MIKNAAKYIIVRISWKFVALYRWRFKPFVVGVTGSMGKTGTKRAIATVVGSCNTVAWQDGNYNDIVTVPLIFFDLVEPSLFNPLAWFIVFLKMFGKLLFGKGAEVVVLELGTDSPGMIPAFGKYLTLDTAVVTGIEAEHLEYFKNVEAVAKEELSVADYAKTVYIDESIKNDGYIHTDKKLLTYGRNFDSEIHFDINKDVVSIATPNQTYTIHPKLAGDHQFYALAVAVAVAESLGVAKEKIEVAASSLSPMPGRMQLLRGKDGSMLIDDTYNASPIAVRAALDYLYGIPQKHRIAVLGNMNEMGESSAELHNDVGNYCDAKQLDMVITIGEDANMYLAQSAAMKGCKIKTFVSPHKIGEFLAQQSLTDTAILFKGSQNGVFLEEAIKPLLADAQDSTRLVRQSKQWLLKKHKQFGDNT